MTAVVILLVAAVLGIFAGVALGFALARAAAVPTPPPPEPEPRCSSTVTVGDGSAHCGERDGHAGPHSGFLANSTTWLVWGDDDSA